MTREEFVRNGSWILKVIRDSFELTQAETDYLNSLIEMLEQESCDDCISRKALKNKLQEHHDFFVNAYGGFSNLPQNDKSRVDEITNCIAMVVNEPPVTPESKTECSYEQIKWERDTAIAQLKELGYGLGEKPKIGHWIKSRDSYGNNHFTCPFCEHDIATKYAGTWKDNYCSNCGAKMSEIPTDSEKE